MAGYHRPDCKVSTLAVEWIEMLTDGIGENLVPGLHPRGGVD